MPRKTILIIIAALLIAASAGVSHAGDEALWTTVTTPDALIILDRTGSMDDLPNGSNPTFYLHNASDTCRGSNGPFYTSTIGTECMNATQLYSADCTNGPWTVGNISSLYTGDLYVAGTNCTTGYNGPYGITKVAAQCLNIPPDTSASVYATTSSCTNSSAVYYTSSGFGHTTQCTQSNMPAITYITTGTDCATGPFYRSSSGTHTTSCNKTCTPCATPFKNSTEDFTGTDCATSPFYRNSGSGHNIRCGPSVTCPTPSPLPYAGDCKNGPFYKTSDTGHPTRCLDCNNPCTDYGDRNTTTSNIPWSATDTCEGPFYTSSGTGHTTNCSKIEIAKRALFSLLDDTNNDSITAADMTSLGMRLGLMNYYNCDSTSSTKAYTDSSGCIKLSWPITTSDNTTATPYANLYCNNTTCASTVTSCTTSTPQKDCIAGFNASGGTPLGYSLREGKSYLDAHKALDLSSTCRQKSIIVVTDGADTYACGGNGSDTNAAQRRSPIYYAQQAAAAKYKVYVVGFGLSMPDDLKNTLNWTAYYGGTRNTKATPSGDTTAVTVGTDPCSNGTDPIDKTLSGYAFMATNPAELADALKTAITSIQEATYSFSSQASIPAARAKDENYLYEASFEPKNSAGANKEPFWTGHLRKYPLHSATGALLTPCWDAGAKLKDMAADDRKMWTYQGASGNALTSFDTTNITAADLAVADDADHTKRNLVVGFYRGDPTYNLENWKLGDLFHTNPVAVPTPTQYFYDPRECGATSYSAFRNTSSNIRTSANGKQLILAGANDGQLHAFRTGNGDDCTAGGDEVWSFIPPNLLQKISPIAHNDHTDRTTLAAHDFFIDGPISEVSSVWLPATAGSGTSKSSSEWKTIAVFGEGQGSGNYLWSSSSTCYSTNTTYFSANFSTTLPTTTNPTEYYCGYYALDVTNTLATSSPTYLWHLMPTTAQAPYLGEAWSKMQIGRVKIAGNERWVGFIGGGYSGTACLSADGSTSTACNTPATNSPGKGFFVVDLKDGAILWSFTHADNSNMDFSAPASPLPVDVDNDGFIDTVYMGDLGGNMWRFRLCPKDACSSCGLSSYTGSPCTSCDTLSWRGSLLYSAANAERGSSLSPSSNTHKQVFTAATATKDTSGNVWVYFGTGENNDPTVKPTDTCTAPTSCTKNRLFAIKEDSNFTATYTTSNLTNATNAIYDVSTATDHGWYKNLSTNALTRPDGTGISSPVGEKMISDPELFGGYVRFATYVPDQGTTNACGLAGDSFLYTIDYLSGATTISYIGHGVSSSILVSYRPGYTAADIYATASGGAGTGSLTQDLGQAPKTSSMTNILYWRDRRLQ